MIKHDMAMRIAAAMVELRPTHFSPNIYVMEEKNYGRNHKYVTSEEHRDAITALTGRKTVTDGDIKALKALGFQVYVRSGKKEL